MAKTRYSRLLPESILGLKELNDNLWYFALAGLCVFAGEILI
jgi:hypothetical protein